MKINRLLVKNFKGIREVSFENLGKINYLVGPNGCGKSSFFEILSLVSKHIVHGSGEVEFPLYGDIYQIFRVGFVLEVDTDVGEKKFNSKIEVNKKTPLNTRILHLRIKLEVRLQTIYLPINGMQSY